MRPTYAQYCQKVFGHRVQKLTVDAGFGCPNRDGTLGTGGCTFCNNEAFKPGYCQPAKSITQQIDEGIEFHRRRRPKAKAPEGAAYIAYLQAYSGTYAPIETLRRRYEEALAHPRVCGLAIGTRPDCVDGGKLDYIGTIAKEHYVMVEYGIESCYDRTLERINRGHGYDCTRRAIAETAARGIACGGHLILGLPGESREEMLAEAAMLSELPLTTLKLHQLQILKGTRMAEEYARDPSALPPAFAEEEYGELVAEFLKNLREDIVVERTVSRVPPRYLAAPERSWKRN